MSKFCGNCGAQLEDQAKVCGYCGAALTDGAEVAVANQEKVNIQSVMKQKKLLPLIAIGIGALVAVIIIVNIISGFVGSKGAARKIMNACRDYDIDALMEMTSEYCYAEADLFGIEMEDIYESRLDGVLEYYENRVGHDYKVKYKIADAYKLPDYRADDIYEEMANLDDFDIGIVSKIMVIELDVTVKGKSLEKEEQWELILTKEDGDWKLFEWSMS